MLEDFTIDLWSKIKILVFFVKISPIYLDIGSAQHDIEHQLSIDGNFCNVGEISTIYRFGGEISTKKLSVEKKIIDLLLSRSEPDQKTWVQIWLSLNIFSFVNICTK